MVAGPYAKVLVDANCSGTAKRPGASRRKNRESRMTWFGVKSIVRTMVLDKLSGQESAVSAEVRVVVFQATDFDAALALAEQELAEYCGIHFSNASGDLVRMVPVDALNVFEIHGELGVGTEVHSMITEVPAPTTDSELAVRFLPAPIDEDRQQLFLPWDV